MFSGIINSLGEIISVMGQDDRRFSIRLDPAPENLRLGDSVACHGICLTAVAFDKGIMQVDASAETLARTTAKDWSVGQRLHLEYALKMGDSLDGHLVFGHVDGLGTVTDITPAARSYSVTFTPADTSLMQYIATKGSIAVDGVSMTVNAVTDSCFTVMIIPHTWAVTQFQAYAVGTQVNLEIDMLARYVARCLAWREAV